MWHKGTMEPGLDLDQASRETLLAVIAEQQDTIAQMGKRVEGLEARLSGGGLGARMPGHKPAARGKKGVGEAKKPRRKRQQGFARLRMEPAGRVVHAPESCPGCHTTLSWGWVQRTREVIELPVCPAEVTEHVFIARRCPLCRKRRLPQDPLKGLAVGRQRLGVNPVSSTGQALSSLIVTLREEAAARKDHPRVSANVPSSDCYLLPFPVAEGCCWAGPVPASCRASTWSCPLGRWCPGLSCCSWMARAGGSLRFRPLLYSGVRMVSRPLRLQPGPAGVARATRPGSGRCGRGSR